MASGGRCRVPLASVEETPVAFEDGSPNRAGVLDRGEAKAVVVVVTPPRIGRGAISSAYESAWTDVLFADRPFKTKGVRCEVARVLVSAAERRRSVTVVVGNFEDSVGIGGSAEVKEPLMQSGVPGVRLLDPFDSSLMPAVEG